MEQTTVNSRHSKFMWAVRQEMGWPLFKPANDCLAFSSGRPMDIEMAMEAARIAQAMRKDMIYSGWTGTAAAEPDSFAVIIRELLQVDVVDRCVAWSADRTSPVLLVSMQQDESFAIGRRGLLERLHSKPQNLAKGRKLAMRRIRAAAAAMGDDLAANNVWLPVGDEWVEPDVPPGMTVRFN